MINLNVKYSSEYEVVRIKGTLEKLQWYKDNKYNPKLPEGLNLDLWPNISENTIKEIVAIEYNEDDFKIQEQYLLKKWSEVIDSAQAEIGKTALQLLDTYTVCLTKYGTNGSYVYPDSVIVNVQSRYMDGLVRVVFHEVVHLMIEQWITEYKTEHRQKERIVDLLTMKFTPNISKTQNIALEITEPIDQIFNDFYPDIKAIIEKVAIITNTNIQP
jgi:hypothetical protein